MAQLVEHAPWVNRLWLFAACHPPSLWFCFLSILKLSCTMKPWKANIFFKNKTKRNINAVGELGHVALASFALCIEYIKQALSVSSFWTVCCVNAFSSLLFYIGVSCGDDEVFLSLSQRLGSPGVIRPVPLKEFVTQRYINNIIFFFFFLNVWLYW